MVENTAAATCLERRDGLQHTAIFSVFRRCSHARTWFQFSLVWDVETLPVLGSRFSVLSSQFSQSAGHRWGDLLFRPRTLRVLGLVILRMTLPRTYALRATSWAKTRPGLAALGRFQDRSFLHMLASRAYRATDGSPSERGRQARKARTKSVFIRVHPW